VGTDHGSNPQKETALAIYCSIDANERSRSNYQTDLKKYITETIGEPTLRDMISELEKPGRYPRAEFKYATFKEGIAEIKDL
jgi:transcriptional accessory protein Tex/SPT6